MSNNRGFVLALVILSIFAIACTKETVPAAVQKIQEPVQQQPVETTPAPVPQTTAPTAPKPTITQQTVPPIQEMVEADDNGFYPSSLTVKQGQKVSILFKVKSVGVYYGGLDFKSEKFNSPSIEPGGSWGTGEFTADETFLITSYWPSSGVKKADFTVEVTP